MLENTARHTRHARHVRLDVSSRVESSQVEFEPTQLRITY